MDEQHKRTATQLIKDVAILQLKVLLGAARDLALGPTAIVAAVFDLVLMKQQEPQFFRMVLRFGEKSDRWIDVWSGGRDDESPRENVEALLGRIEEAVRDPQSGARRARVLRRWAERQIARTRQRATQHIASRLAPPADGSPSD